MSRFVSTLCVLALLVSACGVSATIEEVTAPTAVADETPAVTDAVADPSADGTAALADPIADGASSSRDDIDCTEDALGDEDGATWVAAHYVVDGKLGDLCFGEANDTLVSSWETLAAMTPPDQLNDLGLFAGFATDLDADEITVAFVNTLDDEANQFQMSVNIPAAEDDPDDLLLTMAHEFSHVFTATITQTDRSDEATELCDTFWNGEACYLDDSIMWAWIQDFWGNGLIDEIDPYEDASASLGTDRCEREPQFLGAYAASSPEEDFAESFSAYVLQVDVASPAVQQKLDWFAAQPGIREFRDRAVAAGLGPVPNNYDECG